MTLERLKLKAARAMKLVQVKKEEDFFPAKHEKSENMKKIRKLVFF